MDIHDLIKRARRKENYQDGNGATYSDIRVMESILDVRFPDAYVTLLETVGFMSWFGSAVFGSSRDTYWDVVRHTLISRHQPLPDGWARIPKDCVVINTYGGGGAYALFCKGSPRTSEVALFVDDDMGNEVASWPTLEIYIDDSLTSV